MAVLVFLKEEWAKQEQTTRPTTTNSKNTSVSFS